MLNIDNTEILRYNIENSFSKETAIVMAEIYKYNDTWKINAIGSGFDNGLLALCNMYGVDVNSDTEDIAEDTLEITVEDSTKNINTDIVEPNENKPVVQNNTPLTRAKTERDKEVDKITNTILNMMVLNRKIVVKVINKRNLNVNTALGRYSPRVDFDFRISNFTGKDVRGVQGTLEVKDMFGKKIKSLKCDFVKDIIPVSKYIQVYDIGMDINRFIDSDVKLFNETYNNLIFTYTVTKIAYYDGVVEGI